MSRNHQVHAMNDTINAILAAVDCNFRLLRRQELHSLVQLFYA